MLLSVSCSTNAPAEQTDYKTAYLVNLEPSCPTGLHLQPNGPYAAFVHCNDALANQLGLIYYAPMDAPIDGKWRLNDLFWHKDEKWSQDVTSFTWGPKGKGMFVATASIYGSGGIFWLDLASRTSKRIYSADGSKMLQGKTVVIKILAMDAEKGFLEFSTDVFDDGKSTPKTNKKKIHIRDLKILD